MSSPYSHDEAVAYLISRIGMALLARPDPSSCLAEDQETWRKNAALELVGSQDLQNLPVLTKIIAKRQLAEFIGEVVLTGNYVQAPPILQLSELIQLRDGAMPPYKPERVKAIVKFLGFKFSTKYLDSWWTTSGLDYAGMPSGDRKSDNMGLHISIWKSNMVRHHARISTIKSHTLIHRRTWQSG